MKRNEPKVLMNQAIRAPEVRLIDKDGKMVGVVRKEIALSNANMSGLDLVQMNDEKIPTCKVIDYGKWKYQKEKAEKPQKKVLMKELFFKPNTGQHDVDVKSKHARRFIEDGHKVRLVVQFRGREIAHKDIGYNMLMKVVDALQDIAKMDGNIKMEGKDASVMIVPR